MDAVLKALTRNRLGSENDPDKQAGDQENGRERTISTNSTTSGPEYDQNGDLMSTVLEEEGRKLEEEEKKVHVSIDCTKALVIFGFSNWSELEPGNCKISTISW